MAKNIIITGATGLIGRKLAEVLIRRGDNVNIFSRNIDKAKLLFPKIKSIVEWNYNKPELWQPSIDGSDAVIHLAGINLFDRRWNENFKKEVIESRKIGTHNLVEAISLCTNKPEVFVSASGIGYYGDCGDTLLSEDSSAGKDFLADVCKFWEYEAALVETFNVRSVQIRTGLVLSTEDGALKQMLIPFKLFVGGYLGNGKQWASWLHIDDIVRIYIYAIDNYNIRGAVNAASPNPVKMKEFAKTLGKVLSRPALFPVPKFVLKIAVGEAAEVVVASQKIDVRKLLDSGYKFRFTELKNALSDLLIKRPTVP
ncbi:MAG: TIGR01777 family oxidoreductase [Ignavibacteriaceae bacterium]